jgi:hypothetical protein
MGLDYERNKRIVLRMKEMKVDKIWDVFGEVRW